ncbi:MAG: hypothetical protein M3Q65_03445, partial [Chloroflexota bacterium]|nr:hypothetical protein [Chloroflexota bacterium]
MQAEIAIERDAIVYCNDGPAGVVRQVVVDAAGGAVSDLVVEREDGARLVIPVAAVSDADARTVTLALSRADLFGTQSAGWRYRPEEFSPLDPGLGPSPA